MAASQSAGMDYALSLYLARQSRTMAYPELSLEALRAGQTVITADSAGYFIENCKVCLHAQKHQSGVVVQVVYNDKAFAFCLTWQGETTKAMLRAWQRDDKRNAEIGAIALTMLVLPKLTAYRAIESAGYGTGMDYVLVEEPIDDILIFNAASAYLEVTGIAQETQGNTINSRIAEKKVRIDRVREQATNILGGLPTIIACVEFSRPLVRIVTYE